MPIVNTDDIRKPENIYDTNHPNFGIYQDANIAYDQAIEATPKMEGLDFDTIESIITNATGDDKYHMAHNAAKAICSHFHAPKIEEKQ